MVIEFFLKNIVKEACFLRSTHRLCLGQQFRPESRASARPGTGGQAVHRQGAGQGHTATAARRLAVVRPRRRHGSRA
jgi:hypothetical protein